MLTIILCALSIQNSKLIQKYIDFLDSNRHKIPIQDLLSLSISTYIIQMSVLLRYKTTTFK